MNQLSFRIANNNPLLEQELTNFITEIMDQKMSLTALKSSDIMYKNIDLETIAWLIATIPIIEGNLQFAERIKLVEGIKKLSAAMQKNGQAVYLKIKDQEFDLSQKSIDEILNLLVHGDNSNNQY